MKIYAFDIDETLEISAGPVTIQSIVELRNEGHTVGLCGNWALFVRMIPSWNQFISFIAVGLPKADFLTEFKKYTPADDYVMVGNILGVSGSSDDKGAADKADWRFIKEDDFARGIR